MLEILEHVLHRNFDARLPECGKLLREAKSRGLVRVVPGGDPDRNNPLALTMEGRRLAITWGLCA